jgi:CubicO group peptidase (beta-lactamase class C family)
MPATFSRRSFAAGAAAIFAAPAILTRAARAQGGYARRAAAYNREHRGISMLVMRAGRIVFEDYPSGGAADRAHETASGTKSFCGIVAAAAVQDRLLGLDELAAETLPEWRDDPLRRRITIRHILSLTSGLETRRARGNLLSFEESIAMPAQDRAGQPASLMAETRSSCSAPSSPAS